MPASSKFSVLIGLLWAINFAQPSLAQLANGVAPFAKRNTVRLTGGQFSLAGLQYERLLYQSGRHKLFGGLGLGVTTYTLSRAPFQYRRGWAGTASTSLVYSIGLGQRQYHHLDFGLTYYMARGTGLQGTWSQGVIVQEDVSWVRQTFHTLAPQVGYRYQRPQGGFTWKLGVQPFFYHLPGSLAPGLAPIPFPYAGLGWSF
jgi:hypothetical protein